MTKKELKNVFKRIWERWQLRGVRCVICRKRKVSGYWRGRPRYKRICDDCMMKIYGLRGEDE